MTMHDSIFVEHLGTVKTLASIRSSFIDRVYQAICENLFTRVRNARRWVNSGLYAQFRSRVQIFRFVTSNAMLPTLGSSGGAIQKRISLHFNLRPPMHSLG